jgi:predicted nucleic acid-binding protein
VSFLLDTNVLSELRKRERADRGVRAWFESVDEDELFLSVLTLGEVRQGIERKRRNDSAAARSLERWMASLLEGYGSRVLVIDHRVAEEWGRLNVPDPLPAVDGLIGATALVHDLTVVTRNARDFARTRARVLNPFERRARGAQ